MQKCAQDAILYNLRFSFGRLRNASFYQLVWVWIEMWAMGSIQPVPSANASVCQSRNSTQYRERTIGVRAWFYILQQTFDTFDKPLTHFTKFDTLNTTLTVNKCLSITAQRRRKIVLKKVNLSEKEEEAKKERRRKWRCQRHPLCQCLTCQLSLSQNCHKIHNF